MNRRQKQALHLLVWTCVVLSSLGGFNGCTKHASAPGTAGQAGGSAAGGNTNGNVAGTGAQPFLDGKMLQDLQEEQNVSQVAAQLTNATVSLVTAERPAGSVMVDWQIKESKSPGPKAKVTDIQILIEHKGSKLIVKDKYTGPKTAARPELQLSISVNKDIPVGCNLGNGSIAVLVPLIEDLALSNGDISTNGGLLLPGAGISLGNGSLKGLLLIKEGQHEISTGNGRIELVLYPGSSCAIEATVANGTMETEGFKATRDWHETGGTVSGTVGQGAAKLVLSVANGSVKLSGV